MSRPASAAVIGAVALASAASVGLAEPPKVASDPTAIFYPAAALAAGVRGSADLSCARSKTGALADCKLVSENPQGEGFGDAALALASHSLGSSQPPDAAAQLPSTTRFEFSLSPPRIDPDVLAKDWQLGRRSVHTAGGSPTPGHATLCCEVNRFGRMENCHVTEETPTGRGFGDVALAMALLFKAKPVIKDGVAVDGGVIVIPLKFAPSR
jgi:hypothetical protein